MYRVVVHTEARPAVAALPAEALDGLAEVVDLLGLEPRSGDPYNKNNPDGNVRVVPFGPGGMVTYLILDRDREVHVLEVHWAV